MTDVVVYKTGLCMCSACAPEKMDAHEVEKWVNGLRPTGLDHGWHISEDPIFKTGEPNPCACNQDASRRHWLLEC